MRQLHHYDLFRIILFPNWALTYLSSRQNWELAQLDQNWTHLIGPAPSQNVLDGPEPTPNYNCCTADHLEQVLIAARHV